ncbi:hypothetical protein PINS_up014560 [Pythium insidiosum]|nr:hypothetical protein PINS_up014560 [Pythium insidiosum]
MDAIHVTCVFFFSFQIVMVPGFLSARFLWVSLITCGRSSNMRRLLSLLRRRLHARRLERKLREAPSQKSSHAIHPSHRPLQSITAEEALPPAPARRCGPSNSISPSELAVVTTFNARMRGSNRRTTALLDDLKAFIPAIAHDASTQSGALVEARLLQVETRDDLVRWTTYHLHSMQALARVHKTVMRHVEDSLTKHSADARDSVDGVEDAAKNHVAPSRTQPIHCRYRSMQWVTLFVLASVTWAAGLPGLVAGALIMHYVPTALHLRHRLAS